MSGSQTDWERNFTTNFTFICSIILTAPVYGVYLSADTIFKSLCFFSGFSFSRVVANNEPTQPRVSIGWVITSKFLRSPSFLGNQDWVAQTSIKSKYQSKLKTLKFTWTVHEIHLHSRFNWDLKLIEVCATQSRYGIHLYSMSKIIADMFRLLSSHSCPFFFRDVPPNI